MYILQIHKNIKDNKKIIICLSYSLFIFSFLFSQRNQERIIFPNNSLVIITKIDEEIYKYYYDYNQLFILERYKIDYEKESLSMYITYSLKGEKLKLLQQINKNKLLFLETASNISEVDRLFNNSLLFYSNEDFTIKEYVRSVGNGWTSDDFGFIIKPNDTDYSIINIKINNIYSTYIVKKGYPTIWNKNLIESYNDKNNPGIKFYSIFEKIMQQITIEKKETIINGIVNDEKVRFRKEGDLKSETIRFFEKNEKVEILECSENVELINNDLYPWIKIKTDNGEIGFIYGKYLTVFVN